MRTVNHDHIHPDPIFMSAVLRADRAERESRLELERRHRREIAAEQSDGRHAPESHDHAMARLRIRILVDALAA